MMATCAILTKCVIVNRDAPVVFAGDFNVQPDSISYSWLTQKDGWAQNDGWRCDLITDRSNVSPKLVDVGVAMNKVLCDAGHSHPWLSAYAERHRINTRTAHTRSGQAYSAVAVADSDDDAHRQCASNGEPAVTTSTHSTLSKEKFEGTLDYIFVRAQATPPSFERCVLENACSISVKGAAMLADIRDDDGESALLPSAALGEPSDHLKLSATFHYEDIICSNH